MLTGCKGKGVSTVRTGLPFAFPSHRKGPSVRPFMWRPVSRSICSGKPMNPLNIQIHFQQKLVLAACVLAAAYNYNAACTATSRTNVFVPSAHAA